MTDFPRPIARERIARFPHDRGSEDILDVSSTAKRALASVASFAIPKGKRVAQNGKKGAVAQAG